MRLGSTPFETTVEVISSGDGMLAAMFASEMQPAALDDAGAYIIDRDAAMFHFTLRCLTGNRSVFDELSADGLEKLKVESEFFQRGSGEYDCCRNRRKSSSRAAS